MTSSSSTSNSKLSGFFVCLMPIPFIAVALLDLDLVWTLLLYLAVAVIIFLTDKSKFRLLLHVVTGAFLALSLFELGFRINYFGLKGLDFVHVTPARWASAMSVVSNYSTDTITGLGEGPFCYRGICSRINNLGFRGENFNVEKDPQHFRIVILGSSITMGAGVQDNEIYPNLLEESLNSEFPARKFEVLNSSIPGMRYNEFLYMVKELVPKLDPDMVLIEDLPNHIIYPGEVAGPLQMVIPLTKRPPVSIFNLITKSRFRFFTSEFFILDILNRKITNEVRPLANPKEPVGIEEDLKPVLKDIKTGLGKIPFYILLLHIPGEQNEHISEYKNQLTEMNIRYIDTYNEKYPLNWSIYPGEYHPNAEVHRVYARKIRESLSFP